MCATSMPGFRIINVEFDDSMWSSWFIGILNAIKLFGSGLTGQSLDTDGIERQEKKDDMWRKLTLFRVFKG